MKTEKAPVILLLHKDPYSLYILKEALKEEGYGIKIAGTGEEAVKYLMKQKPALISIDLSPPYKSSIMLFHAIARNKEWSRIPMLTVSGEAGDNGNNIGDWDVFEGRKVFGPSAYLEKPVRLEDYLELIHRALGEPPTMRLLPTEVESIRKRAIEAIEKADENEVIELAAMISAKGRSSEDVREKRAAII